LRWRERTAAAARRSDIRATLVLVLDRTQPCCDLSQSTPFPFRLAPPRAPTYIADRSLRTSNESLPEPFSKSTRPLCSPRDTIPPQLSCLQQTPPYVPGAATWRDPPRPRRPIRDLEKAPPKHAARLSLRTAESRRVTRMSRYQLGQRGGTFLVLCPSAVSGSGSTHFRRPVVAPAAAVSYTALKPLLQAKLNAGLLQKFSIC